MGLEAEALQDALNQPVKKVKELLSSLTSPAPIALSIPSKVSIPVSILYLQCQYSCQYIIPSMSVFLSVYYTFNVSIPVSILYLQRQYSCQYIIPSMSVFLSVFYPLQPQTVFVNEDYVIPQPLPVLPIAGVDQSDCSIASHDMSPISLPLSPQEQQSTLKTVTMETLYITYPSVLYVSILSCPTGLPWPSLKCTPIVIVYRGPCTHGWLPWRMLLAQRRAVYRSVPVRWG